MYELSKQWQIRKLESWKRQTWRQIYISEYNERNVGQSSLQNCTLLQPSTAAKHEAGAERHKDHWKQAGFISFMERGKRNWDVIASRNLCKRWCYPTRPTCQENDRNMWNCTILDVTHCLGRREHSEGQLMITSLAAVAVLSVLMTTLKTVLWFF